MSVKTFKERFRAQVLATRARGVKLTVNGKRLQRNHPCPCESGIKFKKCCGRI